MKGACRLASVAVTFVSTATALRLMEILLPGSDRKGWAIAVGMAAAIQLLQMLMWSSFVRWALPATVVTLGLTSLLLNGIIVWLATFVLGGFQAGSLGATILLTVAITTVNGLVHHIFSIDDSQHFVCAELVAKRHRGLRSDVPGVLFLEIDGLAHEVLLRGIRNGDLPVIASWLQSGTHQLLRWETDWSSQTAACQAGILHGSNTNVPAFRWWQKETRAPVVSSHPTDAEEIERRLSDGHGLLAFEGASRANLLSGDATHCSLTISRLLRPDTRHTGADYEVYFSSPYNLSRTLVLAGWEIAIELWQSWRQRRRDVRPRIDRTFGYALQRAFSTVVQRDLQFHALVGDIYAGRPVVYSSFVGYDEVAHHSGTERKETIAVLKRIDRDFGRLARAASRAPRPYEIVVLSDHGQSQGPTFRDRFGHSLEDIVRDACGVSELKSTGQGNESMAWLSAALSEISAGSSILARLLRRATGRFRVDDAVILCSNSERWWVSRGASSEAPPEVVVMGSGPLGLIYFPRFPGRISMEELNAKYPALIGRLRRHPGLGFLLVHSDQHGPVVLGAEGTRYLDTGIVQGEDPLAPYGSLAARHVRRMNDFQHVADIMVNSAYDPVRDEVFAFEQLVGSHGGLGGAQSFPFVLFPAAWASPDEPIVGAAQVHHWLRRRLADLGHCRYVSAVA